MPAIGFGQKVTGGDAATSTIPVTKTGSSGEGTLSQAIATANANSTAARGFPPQKIVINLPTGQEIAPNTSDLTITARNLTIEAGGGSVINRNHLLFDCRAADNVILRNLRFTSDGLSNPRDTISIDATKGRHGTGFWIDHCLFEAYFDLSITANTRDIPGAPPLLITISNCRFHDQSPTGSKHRNHGAIGIHGYGQPGKLDRQTNAYATVCRNVFDHVRRRSPRSSHLTVVHAFNNLLLDWGSDHPRDDQQNGMEAGHFGILLAGANYFKPNKITTPIEVSGGDAPARLTVARGPRANVYVPPTKSAVAQGAAIDRETIYRDALGPNGTIPIGDPMTDTLRGQISAAAGPTT